MTKSLREYDPENLSLADIQILVDECHRLRSEYVRDAVTGFFKTSYAHTAQAATATYRTVSDLPSKLLSLRDPKPLGHSAKN